MLFKISMVSALHADAINFAGLVRNASQTWISSNLQIYLEYVRNWMYPLCFSKQEKLMLRKLSKQIEYNTKSNSLFYLHKTKLEKRLETTVRKVRA